MEARSGALASLACASAPCANRLSASMAVVARIEVGRDFVRVVAPVWMGIVMGSALSCRSACRRAATDAMKNNMQTAQECATFRISQDDGPIVAPQNRALFTTPPTEEYPMFVKCRLLLRCFL